MSKKGKLSVALFVFLFYNTDTGFFALLNGRIDEDTRAARHIRFLRLACPKEKSVVCGVWDDGFAERKNRTLQKIRQGKQMNKTERCVGYYLDEKDANPAFRPDSASLEDGSVLKALLDKFDGRRDDKALYAVMRCLRDSFLYVKSDMSDFLTDRGRRYLKAFAGFKEGKAEKRRALVSELIKAVEANKELYGVAIEPDTHRFLLGADFMEILKFMPSEIGS